MQAAVGREIAIIKSYIRCRVVVVIVAAPHVISISCRERGDAITICRADAAAAATPPLLHGEQPVFVIEKNLLRRKRELYTRMRRASMCRTAAAAVARRTAADKKRPRYAMRVTIAGRRWWRSICRGSLSDIFVNRRNNDSTRDDDDDDDDQGCFYNTLHCCTCTYDGTHATTSRIYLQHIYNIMCINIARAHRVTRLCIMPVFRVAIVASFAHSGI
ncbi:unnamed protein product [Trichogramma brassicae]|uniref:Uncharacterized protein n=1 Tax=Trichogramma brassicae TaxID=86971 RepID=A0A6H5J2T5_9HYME|nr:unnamed protein product [Trichogramma brassicae]